ncbi:MAG: hypothetical protein ACM3S0_02890 [Acidobacteriota bacterium]
MKKRDAYRQALKKLENWDSLIVTESGLPGPRGNIELAQAVADEGTAQLFELYASFDPTQAPENSPHVMLVASGFIGFGQLVAEGKRKYLKQLRLGASDPRWRVREAVAMALQRVGEGNMELLLDEMGKWSKGNLLEQRAAAAALCGPALLHEHKHVKRALTILDGITSRILRIQARKKVEFKALRQGLGYCWSVAVAAHPVQGKKMMEKWFSSPDPDIVWIMRENLKKGRLKRMDAKWVNHWQARLDSA